MEKVKKSEMLKVLVIASVLITPLLSTSHRSKYIYFILNILILLLGSEAGLVSFFLQKNNKLIFPEFSPDHHRDTSITIIPDPAADHINKLTNYTASHETHSNKAAEKSCSEKTNVREVKPPSIFFIDEEDEREKEELREEVEEELFRKAETFIGNFYKQLKMQREESWNKLNIHLYHHKPLPF